jgi:hypothetical protein
MDVFGRMAEAASTLAEGKLSEKTAQRGVVAATKPPAGAVQARQGISPI